MTGNNDQNSIAPSSSSPSASPLQEHKSKRKRVQKVITTTVSTIMNAAVTIFGVGVGVGLILGDSFRGRETDGRVTVATGTPAASRVGDGYTERDNGVLDNAMVRSHEEASRNGDLLPAQ